MYAPNQKNHNLYMCYCPFNWAGSCCALFFQCAERGKEWSFDSDDMISAVPCSSAAWSVDADEEKLRFNWKKTESYVRKIDRQTDKLSEN